MLMPGIEYRDKSSAFDDYDQIDKISHLCFFFNTGIMLMNLWDIPAGLGERFVQQFINELKNKKVLDAFKRTRKKIYEESGQYTHSLFS